MIHRDYIMRMMQQMGKFLAQVLFDRKSGDHKKVMADVEAAFGSILGFDFPLFNTLSAKDIAEFLGISKDKLTGSMKCIIAARLLKERAEILEQTHKDASMLIPDYQKALSLYLDGVLNVNDTEVDISGYHDDIKGLEGKLQNFIPDEIMLKLFSFHALLEEYDKAENMLFLLKDAGFPGIREMGIEFYRRMELADEAKLIRANMTKEEIEEGLIDFLDGAWEEGVQRV